MEPNLPIRKTLLLIAIFVAFVLGGGGTSLPFQGSIIDSHKHSIFLWEVQHFMDKWLYRSKSWFTDTDQSSQDRISIVKHFFKLNGDLEQLHFELHKKNATENIDNDVRNSQNLKGLQHRINEIAREQNKIRPIVEEKIEAEITATLDAMNITRKFGPLRWPPVDFTFEDSPLVLITSPLFEIKRLPDQILNPGITIAKQKLLEQEAESIGNVSALIVRVGGIATYPASVSPRGSLLSTIRIASHEWVHHHLIFTPLGRRWWDGGEIQSINESVADMVGKEVGDVTYTRLTGQILHKETRESIRTKPKVQEEAAVFDFRKELRETRIQLEKILATKDLEETEKYLEERRELLVENGFYIRKLNQAYFAFHGTYAKSPASLSPIGAQLLAVRKSSANLAEFLHQVSRIKSAEELEQLAMRVGWTK